MQCVDHRDLPMRVTLEACPSSRHAWTRCVKSFMVLLGPHRILTWLQTLRWRPVAPGGVPHALTRDDTYDGYFLPKGTVVVANTWAIHNDESEYDRPRGFMPDRFLNNDYGTRVPVDATRDNKRRTSYAFGAGRRACPGQRLAKNSLVSNLPRDPSAFLITSYSPMI